MRMKAIATVVGLCLASGFSASASAGQFNVWTYKNNDATTQVKVSFSGDKITQDAQLDLAVPEGFQASDAKVLVKGSVCVISAAGDKMRAVPPSGAGKALSNSDVDYCSFSLSPAKGGASGKIGYATPELRTTFKECAGDGVTDCKVSIVDVSEPEMGKRGGHSKDTTNFDRSE